MNQHSNPAPALLLEHPPYGNAPVASTPGGLFSVALVERYWREVKRRKWIVAAIMLGCVIAALVITVLMTPVFTATTRIEISRNQENVTNVQGVEAEEVGQSLEFYQTQYSLLATRSLAARVARSLNLAGDPLFRDAYALDDGEGAALAEVDASKQLDRIVRILLNDIEISPIRGSALVDISYTSPHPALSAKIANAWAQQYSEATLDRRFASTSDARTFLEGQLADLKDRLEKSESDLVNYAADKRIIALSTSEASDGATRTEQTLAASDLQGLATQLVAATADRITAESAWRTGGGASEAALGNSAINALRQQRATVAADYARMLQQFEPAYPSARALKSQLDALEEAIRAEEARASSGVQRQYRQAAAREAELRSRVEGLKGQLIGQRRDSIQYAIYQREVDTNRELYDALLQRFKEIGVAGVGSNNIAVVDLAQAPTGPSSPSLVLNVLLALIVGGAVSAIAVVIFEMVDQSVRDPQDVQQQLGLPLLGSIPRAREGAFEELVRDRKSEAAEAYLSVKTSLTFLTENGVPRSLMLTSTGPNEGKSVSTLALADILARGGSKVILIDADMRNPSALKLLNMHADAGLSNYLSGQDEASRLILPTGTPDLNVMGAGPPPPNAAELLAGPRFRQLISLMLEQYDHVLIDSPPVLGLADAPLISASVEGVVLAVEANRYKLRAVSNSIGRLRSANARMLGAIVTKVDHRNSAYGYGYGYGYGYRYGEGADG